jgi:hypothetical protein
VLNNTVFISVMRQEIIASIIASLICSACVGLAALSGTVLISKQRIETLVEDIKETQQSLANNSKETQRLLNVIREENFKLRLEVLSIKGALPRQTLRRLNDLNSQEIGVLSNELISKNLNFNEQTSSRELITDERLSSQTREIIKKNQLTGDDLKTYSSVLENIPQEQRQMIFENPSSEK